MTTGCYREGHTLSSVPQPHFVWLTAFFLDGLDPFVCGESGLIPHQSIIYKDYGWKSASRSPDPAITGCQTLAHVKFTPATGYSDNASPCTITFIIHRRSNVGKSCIELQDKQQNNGVGEASADPAALEPWGSERPPNLQNTRNFCEFFPTGSCFLSVLRQNSYWIPVIRSGRNFANNYRSPPPRLYSCWASVTIALKCQNILLHGSKCL